MLDKLYHYCISIFFVLLIAMPASIWLSSSNAIISKNENRKLKELPDFSFNKEVLKQYPKEFENYFKDHYGLRHELVNASESIKLKLFDKSPISIITRGANDWLFVNYDASLEDHIGMIPLSQDILNQWHQHLINKEYWLNNLGAKYLLVPAPNKMSMYPEYLPKRIQRHSGSTMLDKLLIELDKHDNFNGYVNLEPLLLKQKHTALTTLKKLTKLEKTESLYFKKDTHWTSFGAFLSYQHIMAKLKTMLPDLSPALTFDDIYTEKKLKRGDLARMSLITSKEIHHHIKQKKQCATEHKEMKQFKETEAYKLHAKRLPLISGCHSKNLRAVIVNDSFGAYLRTFFSESFNQVIFMSSYDLIGMEGFLREFKPDIFIDIRVERNIKHLLAPNERLQKRVAEIKHSK